MEVFILGTSGMMPLPNRHLSSILLRREGSLFLFDCGEATQVALRKLNLKWKKIDAIFITHTHADHVTGLPGLLMLSSQVERDDPLYIIGPPKIKDYIQANRDTLDMYINYEIIIIEIDPTKEQEVFKGDGFNIKAVPMRHSKPCVAYVFEEDARAGIFYPDKAKELGVPMGQMWSLLQQGQSVEVNGSTITSDMVLGSPRSGRKVSFVTDTLYFDGIAEAVKNSNLLICEGMFGEGMEDTAKEKKHMSAYQSGLVAKAGQVLKMGITHYSPRYMDRELPLLLAEAHKNYSEAFLCKDKMEIKVPHID